jgi:hypothetical protein
MIAFWIYFSIYIAILLFVWGFFLIAKIHVYKFKEYSPNVVRVTRFVGLSLLFLTAIWFYIVFRELSGTTPAPTTVRESSQIETY